jgi:hypothetical protein
MFHRSQLRTILFMAPDIILRNWNYKPQQETLLPSLESAACTGAACAA